MEITTLTDALASIQLDDRNIRFINASDDEQVLTFAQLYSRSLGLLKVFQDRGLEQGDELIIYNNNNQFFLEAFWACLLGGIIPVPVAIGISDEHRAKLIRIFEKLSKPHIYTDKSQHQRITDFIQSSRCTLSLETLNENTVLVDQVNDIATPGQLADIKLDDTAFIQFSSGSTSDPKGVVLTHRNVITNIKAIGERDQMTAQDIALSWMPLTHDMGLIGFHLVFLLHQASHCIMPADLFSRRPLLWLLKAAEHKATVLNSPNFGYKHFLKVYKPEKLQGIDLSAIRMIYNGAEPISVELYQNFLQTMAAHSLKPTVMHTVYGMAEASLAVSLPHPGVLARHVKVDRHKIKIGDKVVFLSDSGPNALLFAIEGSPVNDCFVRIVNAENKVLDDACVGEILIKGDNVTPGYYLDEDINRQLISEDGWLNTGDVGFIYNGELVVTGRSKDIIFVNGQNYYPHDIETLLTQHESFELGKVVAAGISQDVAENNELLIFILHRNTVDDFLPIAKKVARSVNEHMGLEVGQVIPVKRIPKTTSGKIQRNKLVEMYMQGDFAEQIAQIEGSKSKSSDILDGLSDVEWQLLLLCRNAVENHTIGINDNLFEIGISSLALSELHEKIEDLYPDKVDIVDLFDHQTLAELAKYIDSK